MDEIGEEPMAIIRNLVESGRMESIEALIEKATEKLSKEEADKLVQLINTTRDLGHYTECSIHIGLVLAAPRQIITVIEMVQKIGVVVFIRLCVAFMVDLFPALKSGAAAVAQVAAPFLNSLFLLFEKIDTNIDMDQFIQKLLPYIEISLSWMSMIGEEIIEEMRNTRDCVDLKNIKEELRGMDRAHKIYSVDDWEKCKVLSSLADDTPDATTSTTTAGTASPGWGDINEAFLVNPSTGDLRRWLQMIKAKVCKGPTSNFFDSLG
ncbi:hypothetical protein H0H81_011492 [Sphagnurus paluster]|uniref:Uncharacterized protein n=1 Tax=Sphagnurus paluster TaxID=117069 RepID=A0A9P7G0M9_9AGAR|nr:hypothetical protein H0H81_011492 [Sphagnurus paluster]